MEVKKIEHGKTDQKTKAMTAQSEAALTMFAQATAAPANGANSIDAISASTQGGVVTVKVTLKRPFEGALGSFSVASPARVAIDFPGTVNGLGLSAKTFNEGELRSANVIQVANRTRLVLNLQNPRTFETRSEGNDVYITLAAGAVAGDKSPSTTTARFVEQKGGPDQHAIQDISFRRGSNGQSRVVIDLSDPNIGIDIRQQGQNLVLEFLKT